MSDPLSAIEGAEAMRSLAMLLSEFRGSLREEGFDEAEAMRLTAAYVQGLAAGTVKA